VTLWFPLAWSMAHGYQPLPYEAWILWHFTNREAVSRIRP
jgi:hypothetical protein